MDETALIAMGILMEETAREVLGETGDFAFVEAANDEEEQALESGDKHEGTDIEDLKSSDVLAEEDSDSTSDGSHYSSRESD